MRSNRVTGRQPTLFHSAPATVTLAGLCTLSWFVQLFAFRTLINFEMALVPARLTGHAQWQDAAIPAMLTPLTMTFVHGGFGHLALNMVFLLFIGRFVETLIGSARVLALYFACAVSGPLLEVVLAPTSVVPYVGASGAIAGVFAAHAMIFGRRQAGGTETKRAFQLAAVWIGLQLALGLVFNGGSEGGIAIWAHVGGFLAGLVLALPMARSALAQR